MCYHSQDLCYARLVLQAGSSETAGSLGSSHCQGAPRTWKPSLFLRFIIMV